jgi:hypothetical protein
MDVPKATRGSNSTRTAAAPRRLSSLRTTIVCGKSELDTSTAMPSVRTSSASAVRQWVSRMAEQSR